MKNVRLYTNYSGSDKILVNTSNYVYDIKYGNVINFVAVDLFQLITIFFLIRNNDGVKKIIY